MAACGGEEVHSKVVAIEPQAGGGHGIGMAVNCKCGEGGSREAAPKNGKPTTLSFKDTHARVRMRISLTASISMHWGWNRAQM